MLVALGLRARAGGAKRDLDGGPFGCRAGHGRVAGGGKHSDDVGVLGG
jgi:hypothetical protein